MSITRKALDFDADFTRIPNTWARDRRLTRKARGLLVEIMSHRVGWKITFKALVKQGSEGRDAVYSMVNELVALGYLTADRTREKGKFGETDYQLSRPFVEPENTVESADEWYVDPVDNSAVSGLSGTVKTATVSGFSVSGKSAPKKTMTEEEQINQSSAQGQFVRPVDNDDDNSAPSTFPKPHPTSRRKLNVIDLISRIGHVFAGTDVRSDQVATLARTILKKSPTEVLDETAYVAASILREPHYWQQQAFDLVNGDLVARAEAGGNPF